jgi:NADPH:quinone reductase-like Zn-dependent oxidoreductase
MATMKAVVLEAFGSNKGFALKDIAIPELKEGHVLVTIKAVAFNPVDYKIRLGNYFVNEFRIF